MPYMSLVAAFLVTLTALGLVMTVDWRWNIILLAVQYAGVALLLSAEWPLPLAVTSLVAGWMAGAILGMALQELPAISEVEADLFGTKTSARNLVLRVGEILTRRIFLLLVGLLVILVVLSRADRMVTWIPGIHLEQSWAGLALIGLGLLKLGFTLRTFPTIVGLLTALSGFEILYASLERSVLVAGLLAGITLGLAFIGAYLFIAPGLEASE